MLITQKDPKAIASEAYRTLRTNIQYSSFDKEISTILVTSTAPGEGKSVTCGNLALTMAQAGKRVLVIDCDLRKPTLHKKFTISNRTGISNFLLGQITLEEVMYKYSDKLCLLPSGTIPPNPSEMLSSKKLKEFLKSMKGVFDYIIIDSPPVMAVTDAQILSTIADGVLLVAASGQTQKEGLVKAKEQILKVGGNLLGVVLNKVPIKTGKGYGNYYYYYGGDDKKW